jgi:hypothetical protein
MCGFEIQSNDLPDWYHRKGEIGKAGINTFRKYNLPSKPKCKQEKKT